MIAEGADILDIGGESTRPGHTPGKSPGRDRAGTASDRGCERAALISPSLWIPTRASVAEEALKHGADLINDIWGLKYEPRDGSCNCKISGCPAV